MRLYTWSAVMHDGFHFTVASDYGVSLKHLMCMPMSIEKIIFTPKRSERKLPTVKIIIGMGRCLKHCREIWFRPFGDMASVIKEQIIHYDNTRIAIDLVGGSLKVMHG